ncbi:unnamed protein product, partial [Porites evermanni]
AQSWLFCVSLFVCVVLRKKGRILEVDFDGDGVVLVDSDLWLLKICRQSVKLHQDEAILPPLIQVTGLCQSGKMRSLTASELTTLSDYCELPSTVDRATDLLRMLLLEAVTSKGGSVDPGDRLVNASSNGNLQEVREILEAHPGKVFFCV